ncbi:hypothetical protein WN51_14045 [Melipona quadrifasciata]|uniref:Uncharacterized protein n=1 Tax=Melipona quadrifasciata TaxID=166423 RepID=A0A0M8ZZA2_9HYME|nr:hypothetical protein WN51_14045 [Melipona quadrifasciata]
MQVQIVNSTYTIQDEKRKKRSPTASSSSLRAHNLRLKPPSYPNSLSQSIIALINAPENPHLFDVNSRSVVITYELKVGRVLEVAEVGEIYAASYFLQRQQENLKENTALRKNIPRKSDVHISIAINVIGYWDNKSFQNPPNSDMLEEKQSAEIKYNTKRGGKKEKKGRGIEEKWIFRISSSQQILSPIFFIFNLPLHDLVGQISLKDYRRIFAQISKH